jgi:hypothetical protein
VEPLILAGKVPRVSSVYRSFEQECELMSQLMKREQRGFCQYVNCKLFHYFKVFHSVLLINFISEFVVDAYGNILLSDINLFEMKDEKKMNKPKSTKENILDVLQMISQNINEKHEREFKATQESRDLSVKILEGIQGGSILKTRSSQNTRTQQQTSNDIFALLTAKRPRKLFTLRDRAPKPRDAQFAASTELPVYYLEKKYATNKKREIRELVHRSKSRSKLNRSLDQRRQPAIRDEKSLSSNGRAGDGWRVLSLDGTQVTNDERLFASTDDPYYKKYIKSLSVDKSPRRQPYNQPSPYDTPHLIQAYTPPPTIKAHPNRLPHLLQ